MSPGDTIVKTNAVILAGGLARRMGGGDKCRLVVGGQSIVERTIDCVRPQVTALSINANGDVGRFADLGLAVLRDGVPGFPGPLAGVLAGLEWAAGLGAEWLVSIPGDCPFLPADLVERLHAARDAGGGVFACAGSGGRTHPVVGLWPVSHTDELRRAMLGGERKIDAFTGRWSTATAWWDVAPRDPFLNVNSPADLEEAERPCGDVGL